MTVDTCSFRLELGATPEDGGVHFAVWAPRAAFVDIEVAGPREPTQIRLSRGSDGVHVGRAPGLAPGSLYRYRLDGNAAYPDPYSRFQPQGPHGPSEVIDPSAFEWSDGGWAGLRTDGLVVYECHVGTITGAGTFVALIGELRELRQLGATAIELMPVAECPGRWNWGYDGVDLFAPSHNYGRPADLKRLVDEAHRVGLGIILDVVYNHLGPDGNYLRAYSADYFTARHQTPWGDALNYDGPNSRRVRDYVIDNACYWLTEYHVDGLRLDAIDTIVDDSPTHVLAELTERARAAAPRSVVLIAEDARNDVRTVHPVARGGLGCDAVWADDFHHAVRVLLSGEQDGYYADYAGTTSEIGMAITEGFVYRGQRSPRTGRRRGTPTTDERASAFVFCIQNHDQVGNRPFGDRLNHQIDQDRYAVASALLLFAPETPLLFMGQEFAASAPFLYFTDHLEELGMLVTAGRREEFKGFGAIADPGLQGSIPDPQDEQTFLRSKLDSRERTTRRGIYRLYRDLLRLRQSDPVLSVQDRTRVQVGRVGAEALVVDRWQDDRHRLMVANFGAPIAVRSSDLGPAELPLDDLRLRLATSRRRYGGPGDRPRLRGHGADRRLEIPARTAAIFEYGPLSGPLPAARGG